MRREERKSKGWLPLILVGGLTVCAFGAWRLIDYATERLLQLDVELTAVTWAGEIGERVEGLDGLMVGRPLSAEAWEQLAGVRGMGGVRRFKIYNLDDRLRHDSGWEALFDSERSAALEGLNLDIGKAAAPLVLNGRPVGRVEIYVDQTRRAAVFERVVLGLGASIALLLMLAAGAPAYLAERRARERRRAERQAHYVAQHDSLTGLENRRAFRGELQRVVSAAGDEPLALIAVDLDRFKEINDTLGHGVGDEVIVQAAERVRKAAGRALASARTGGDEFCVVIGCDGPDAAGVAATRIHAAMAEPFLVNGRKIHCSASVGFALHPTDASHTGELARCADVALECAKHAGRDRVRSFDSAMDGAMRRRRSLQHDLRDAIREEQLEVHFQPLVAVAEGRVKGFEALLRWRHPERGIVSTQEFVSIAEESGLIIALGSMVLRRACEEAASWPEPWTIAVNLSPAQFHSGELFCEVERALAQSGLAPERLELEITEGLLLDTGPETHEVLDRLRSSGVRIALDDFGAGYSSLSHLWRLPLDKLKIDRAFVMEMCEDTRTAAIVSAIITLGDALDLEVTAEGVETPDQFERLKALGCDSAQGYWLSRPAPDARAAAQEAEDRLRRAAIAVA